MNRKLVTRWVIDIVYITLGAAIYAFGYTIFIRYNSLTPGGIVGNEYPAAHSGFLAAWCSFLYYHDYLHRLILRFYGHL